MPDCDNCHQPALVLINVLGAMLCLECEARANAKTREDLRQLCAMTEQEFADWLAEEKRGDAPSN